MRSAPVDIPTRIRSSSAMHRIMQEIGDLSDADRLRLVGQLARAQAALLSH